MGAQPELDMAAPLHIALRRQQLLCRGEVPRLGRQPQLAAAPAVDHSQGRMEIGYFTLRNNQQIVTLADVPGTCRDVAVWVSKCVACNLTFKDVACRADKTHLANSQDLCSHWGPICTEKLKICCLRLARAKIVTENHPFQSQYGTTIDGGQ